MVDTIIKNDRKTDEVKQILVKEKWFFDKNLFRYERQHRRALPDHGYTNRLDDQGLAHGCFILKRLTLLGIFSRDQALAGPS
ncbi:MAG: hypothetical protein MZV63_13095 [Marinilabiliales bacterium]|nr:hypothetical protein [Marinilabiliales bacterium]